MRYSYLAILCLVALAPLCGAKTAYFSSPDFSKLKSSKTLTLIPMTSYQQVDDHTCAPAAMMSLLAHFGLLKASELNHARETQVAKDIGTTIEEGTWQHQLVTWLEKQTLKVNYGKDGDLKLLRENLRQGVPVIVNWIDWGGHWAIVIGYDDFGTKDLLDDVIILADPADYGDDKRDGITYFNAQRFQYMWFEYGKPNKREKGLWITAQKKLDSK